MTQFLDLTDRTALVTGASSGIGAATAATLAELGAQVALSYHHNQRGAEETRDRILAAGGKAVAIAADVRRPDDIKTLVARTVSDLGPVDILVNNAGSLVARYGILEITPEALQDVVTLNFNSAVLASQAVTASMIERRRGVIINVVSIAGHTGGGPGASIYASSKAALTAFTKALAKELAQKNVRVNAVSPGVIATPFHEVFSTPDMIAGFVKTIPLGRVGTPEDVAAAVAYLAGPGAAYVTGQVLRVNGGLFM